MTTRGLIIVSSTPLAPPPCPWGGRGNHFRGIRLNDHSDPHKGKYFCEALDLKYNFDYSLGVPQLPTPYPPRPIYGWGPMGGSNGSSHLCIHKQTNGLGVWGVLNEGGDCIPLTPNCYMFLENPCPNIYFGLFLGSLPTTPSLTPLHPYRGSLMGMGGLNEGGDLSL